MVYNCASKPGNQIKILFAYYTLGGQLAGVWSEMMIKCFHKY